MTNHDTRYRDLFSHVYMVRALFTGILQTCVDDDAAVPDADPFNWDRAHMLHTSFVTDGLQQRHGDYVWRLPYRDGRAIFILLLLEHQSQVDSHMALRVLVYTGLLYQSLIKQGIIAAHDPYPTMLPVVLYSGIWPWTAAISVGDKLADNPTLRHLQPAMSYILVDEGELVRRNALPC